MVYLDTSFVAPLFVKEATSDAIVTALESLSLQEIYISDWVSVEFSSLIARKVRMKELSTALATEIIETYFLTVKKYWNMIKLSSHDFDRAATFIGDFQTGLRAGDALHLGLVSNRPPMTIYSLDKGLIQAAKKLRISCQGFFL